MNSVFHLPAWRVNAICALRFCLHFSASSLSGLSEPKAEAILKYQGGNRTQSENIHPWSKCDLASIPFIPLKALDFRSSGTCWLPNPRDASRSSSWCLFLKDLDFDNSSLFHALSLVPRTKSSLTFALFFFFFFRKLLRAARCFSFTFASYISCLQETKWNPLCLHKLFRFWVDSWHLRFSYSLHLRTVSIAVVSVPSLIRSPRTPSFCIFNIHRSVICYCTICSEFSSPPCSLLLPFPGPHHPSLELFALVSCQVPCLQPLSMTPASAVSKTKCLSGFHSPKGKSLNFLCCFWH